MTGIQETLPRLCLHVFCSFGILLLLSFEEKIKIPHAWNYSVIANKIQIQVNQPYGWIMGHCVYYNTKELQNNVSKEGGAVSKEKTDPIVAFSRPPPLPPFLGPLVALSRLETWSGRDSDDN